MQTGQIPLSLFGVKGFDYTKNDLSEVVYDPSKQVTNKLFLTQSGRDTISDLGTTCGLLMLNTDDE